MYRDVPYHNVFHAFDVTQTIYALARHSGLVEVYSAEERLALLLSAVCHDMDHMGLNNAYHIKAQSAMALLQQTAFVGPARNSILEFHHCRLGAEMIAQTGLLAALPEAARRRVHTLMFDNILATDMAQHKDLLTRVQDEFAEVTASSPVSIVVGDSDGTTAAGARTSAPSAPKVAGASSGESGSSTASAAASPLASPVESPGFDVTRADHRALSQILLLKMADISNTAKEFELARRWALAVVEEFYRQGDVERAEGHDVPAMFDRTLRAELAKSQIGFIQFVTLPFFSTAARAFPAFQLMADGCTRNLTLWKRASSTTLLLRGSGRPGSATATVRVQHQTGGVLGFRRPPSAATARPPSRGSVVTIATAETARPSAAGATTNTVLVAATAASSEPIALAAATVETKQSQPETNTTVDSKLPERVTATAIAADGPSTGTAKGGSSTGSSRSPSSLSSTSNSNASPRRVAPETSTRRGSEGGSGAKEKTATTSAAAMGHHAGGGVASPVQREGTAVPRSSSHETTDSDASSSSSAPSSTF
jgi:hypothetical protein